MDQLSGAKQKPEKLVKTGWIILYILAVINVLLGILAYTQGMLFDPATGIGIIIFGLLLAGMGVWAQKTQSATPFWIAIALLVFDMVLSISMGGMNGGGIALRVAILLLLWQATQGAKRMGGGKNKTL